LQKAALREQAPLEQEEIRLRKAELRQQGLARRRAQPHKDEISRRILAHALGLPQYQRAQTVMFYVGVRSEVRTRDELSAQLASDKRIVVPYCAVHELELFHLWTLDELERGGFGLLEPRLELRGLPQRQLPISAVDLVFVPGVAFDPRGVRCGHGKGYYDRLLRRVRPDTFLAGLAFQCQVFPEIPVEEHDVLLDAVITEEQTYCS
jgi:5-formyltetrahydrofolate cyclo-ligase